MHDSYVHPRERILAAAQKLFSARGYSGTGVQDIVNLAGVTKPTLYYYFKHKAGLYQTLVEEAFNRRLEIMEQAAAQHTSVQDKIAAIMNAMMAYTREHTELMRIAYSNFFAGPEEVPAEVRGTQKAERNFEFVLGLVKEGIASGELDGRFDCLEMTMVIYGQFYMAVSVLTMHPEKWQEQWGQQMIRLVFAGAAAKKGSSAGAVEPVSGGV